MTVFNFATEAQNLRTPALLGQTGLNSAESNREPTFDLRQNPRSANRQRAGGQNSGTLINIPSAIVLVLTLHQKTEHVAQHHRKISECEKPNYKPGVDGS
jgi:hypothetical protein